MLRHRRGTPYQYTRCGSTGCRDSSFKRPVGLSRSTRVASLHMLSSSVSTFSPLETIDLHLFVGQSLPSSSSTVCFQSCQLSVCICSLISSRLLSIHLRLGRPLLLFPGTTYMSIIFIDKLSSSLLIWPYQFNRFCLRNVDIVQCRTLWHPLV